MIGAGARRAPAPPHRPQKKGDFGVLKCKGPLFLLKNNGYNCGLFEHPSFAPGTRRRETMEVVAMRRLSLLLSLTFLVSLSFSLPCLAATVGPTIKSVDITRRAGHLARARRC